MEVTDVAIKQLWEEYCETVEMPTWTISLQLVQYLRQLVKEEEIKSVLDLGAGFSSVLFRLMGIRTDTVETDIKWIAHAMGFCRDHNIEFPLKPGKNRWIERRVAYDLRRLPNYYDLVLVDSDDSVREYDILEAPKYAPRAVVDDCHRPKEIQTVRRACDHTPGWDYKTLESTKNGYGRVAALMQRMY